MSFRRPARTYPPTTPPRTRPTSPISAPALGISQWNVFGLSYGTDLAQRYVRDHSEGIRSVVLNSVIPVTITLAKYWESTRAGFDSLFQACVAQAACNTAHPNLEATVTNLVNMLEAAPLTTATPDPVDRRPQ